MDWSGHVTSTAGGKSGGYDWGKYRHTNSRYPSRYALAHNVVDSVGLLFVDERPEVNLFSMRVADTQTWHAEPACPHTRTMRGSPVRRHHFLEQLRPFNPLILISVELDQVERCSTDRLIPVIHPRIYRRRTELATLRCLTM